MRWDPCFLALVALAAACVVEDKPVTPPFDGSVDAGECVFCPEEEPVCVEGPECVQCAAGEDNQTYCTDHGQVCDFENQVCVDCLDDAQCTSVNASRCDLDINECAQCQNGAQCNDVDGLPASNNACDEGVCRECTPETEAETCPSDKTCNPDSYECTGKPAGSLGVCEECVADSECGDEGTPSTDYRCVPMYYPNGLTRFPNDNAGFCLKTTEGGCERPYAVTLFDWPSLSEPTSEANYCGLEQSLTTCPAVLALLGDDICPGGMDAECSPGGICRDVGSLQNRCTYLCGLRAQCPADAPADTCGSSGPSGDDYCGG